MDEVDGMSSGDRGGVGALNALIKKTKVPIIAICNDKSNPKMKPLMSTCFQMVFRRYVFPRSGCTSTSLTQITAQAECERDQVANDDDCLQVRSLLDVQSGSTY
jgi:DNA polymerase III delta prime subunit